MSYGFRYGDFCQYGGSERLGNGATTFQYGGSDVGFGGGAESPIRLCGSPIDAPGVTTGTWAAP